MNVTEGVEISEAEFEAQQRIEEAEYKAALVSDQAIREDVIAMGLKAERLAENPDFQDLFMDYLLTKEPVRMAHNLGAQNLRGEDRNRLVEDVKAIGFFSNKFSQLVRNGRSAKVEYDRVVEELKGL